MQKKNLWKFAWSQPVFRYKVLIGFILNIPLLILFPVFFQHIEQRNGTQLQDVILNQIPSIDVSLPIFIIIWFVALLLLIRAIQQPDIFITFLFSFFVLSITRIITITFIPLNSPKGLIPLIDPITSLFYGKSFITKDLFYSGHVATQFLIFLILKKRTDKWITVFSTISIAILILLQHVHYTIDVIAAPVLAYGCYMLGKNIAVKGIQFKKN